MTYLTTYINIKSGPWLLSKGVCWFRNTMQQLGLTLSQYDVQAMMKSVGVGPRGKITFDGMTLHSVAYLLCPFSLGSICLDQ